MGGYKGYENPNVEGLDPETIKNELIKQYTHHTQIFDEQEQDDSVVQTKFVVLGPQDAGKTSWVTRLTQHKFDQAQKPTTGANYALQGVAIEELVYNIEIWDVSGDTTYKSLVPMYLQYADAAIIFYDSTSQSSFNSAKGWVKYVQERKEENMIIALIGTKADSIGDASLKVDKAEVEKYATEHELEHFPDVSAKTGEGVEDVMLFIAESIHEKKILKETVPKENDEYDAEPYNFHDSNAANDDKIEEIKEQLSGCYSYLNVVLSVCFKQTKEASKVAYVKSKENLKEAATVIDRKSRKFGQESKLKLAKMLKKESKDRNSSFVQVPIPGDDENMPPPKKQMPVIMKLKAGN